MTIDAELLRDLAEPRAYPHSPRAVDVVQTHISCVFLAGDDVYKVKKVVRFSFLDFSTLALRRHFCEEEVRLNRRLAPDVYRGVVPIVRGPSGHVVGGTGEPVEYAVHMRRLPDDRLLDALLSRGEADDTLMQRIAAKIAAFHAAPDTEPRSTHAASPEELRRTLVESFDALRAHTVDAPTLDVLERLVLAALSRIAPTLRERARAGRVRDGHGDLRPDHICCDAELAILDCVEFSERLRICDVASDVAFLASELDFADAAPLADAFVTAYVDMSGDTGLPAVLPFFRAYRALVRALVSAITAAEPEVDADLRTRSRDRVTRYLALAARAAWNGHAPFVVGVMGRSGSGKSTLAAGLGEATGAAVLRSDVLRKRLAGVEPLARPASAADLERLYGDTHSEAVYAALADGAARLLAGGRTVVVDATFLRRRDRARIDDVARAARTPVFWIECRAATPVLHERLRARAERNDDASDATPTVSDAQESRLEPLDDEVHASTIRTDADPAPVATALRWLASRLTGMDAPARAC